MVWTRRRPTFRLTLLVVLTGLLLLTVAALAGVAHITMTRAVDELQYKTFSLATVAVGGEIRSYLSAAIPLLRGARAEAANGQLPLDDPDALGRALAGRLRYFTTVAWLSYSDQAHGQFVGVRRSADGTTILNQSRPDIVGGRPRELELTIDGRLIPLPRAELPSFDPRERDWYRRATASDDVVWTEPFQFNEGVMGVTAALAVPRSDGIGPRGAFTADFSLDDLSRFLTELPSGRNAHISVISRGGAVVASSHLWSEDAAAPIRAAGLRALPTDLASLDVGRPVVSTIEEAGVPYIVVVEATPVAERLEWVTVIMMARADYLRAVDEQFRFALLIGALLLAVALGLGGLLAYRISEPLRAMARDLERVGRFEMSAVPSPRSFVEEIGVMGDAVDRMKASLRSFARYVPRQLVYDVLASGREARLGGQHRVLTIFFSDIEGFTRISETLEPDLLVEHLGEYLDAMTSVIESCDGTVDKFIGDGILALFNAPRDVPDHAARACRAALQAQARLAVLEDEWRECGRPMLRTRIGLHTGEAIVGNVGTRERFEYTVVGDGVNLASRLESANKLYGTRILASQAVREAAGPGFEWRTLDRLAVVGRTQGVPVHELLGEVGAVAGDTLSARDIYERALEAYMARCFDEAAAGFRHAASLAPEDRAAPMMAARTDALRAEPPPSGWGGVHVMKAK
jgi:adenylate cyclase